jgi:hypothetical protein
VAGFKRKIMMYQSKLVASLKANGKILREFKDTVYIPFGSEYSFLLKNLNTTRALVNVFIDGEDMTPGGLVLNAGQEVDLERSIKGGNLKEGNRFKFIERTQSIEDGPRGIKLEDGLVRIEFQFEKSPVKVSDLPDWQQKSIFGPMFGNHGGIVGGLGTSEYTGVTDKYSNWISASGATTNVSQMNVGGALRGVDWSKNGEVTAQAASASIDKYNADNGIINKFDAHDGSATMDWCQNEVGITVPGSKSTQSFTTTYMNAMESEKHTIVLKLLGETPDNKPVLQPVNVKMKPKCVTCGKQNKATAKFCSACGTALEIFA